MGIRIALSNIEFINGLFSLIFVLISVTVGLKMASKYLTHKNKDLLIMGVSWIGITSPWWSSSVSFIHALITGMGITELIYFSISNPIAPWFMVIYILGITNLLHTKHQKYILIAFIVMGAIFEVYYVTTLFTNPSNIGNLESQIDVQYTGLTMIYLILNVLTIFILGIYFGKETLKSTNSELKLKGKFLILAFLCYFIGGVLDSAIPLSIISLSITRIILICGSLFFYSGFILPKWIKKRLI